MTEPLDLGVVRPGDADPPDPPDPARRTAAGRWRWVAVALAFVVGGTVGLVVADARDDADGYAGIELFGGPVQSLMTGPRPRGELSVTLLNAGERPVEIVGVEVEGMRLADGAEPAEPVAAEPGVWTTYLQRDIQVDCSGPLPGAVRVRVRTGTGDERLVEVAPPDNYDGLRGFWYYECQTYEFGLQVRDSAVVEAGDESVVLRLELANDGFDDVVLGGVESRAPGFALTADADAVTVPAGESVAVTTTWTVRDCDPALAAAGGSLGVRIGHDGVETEQIIVLPDQGFVALARLSGRACPARIQE
ncbi:hypothetical protein [Jiangella anatolica]|uniref:Uncharacterized protein n=1 Tax=Jiangella anatolica TaxID=2670374 RepID=A0A2W2C3R5_9ACTN|nr:hypothetical protein [Jiangella anatolica]PZF82637.1 hypothetical protein C1I92_16010 [Jiangella anatolica]